MKIEFNPCTVKLSLIYANLAKNISLHSLLCSGRNFKTYDVSHAFLPLTIAKVSLFKNSPVFWPTLYVVVSHWCLLTVGQEVDQQSSDIAARPLPVIPNSPPEIEDQVHCIVLSVVLNLCIIKFLSW